MTPDLDLPQDESPTATITTGAATALADNAAKNGTASNGEAIPLTQQLDQNLDDDTNPQDVILARPGWGSLAAAAAAASFDTIFSKFMEAADPVLFRNVDLRGIGSINDGTMSLDGYFKEMFVTFGPDGEKKDDDDLLGQYADAVDDERTERRREREEWANSEHSFAGVEMTGQEWGDLSDELGKDTPLHRRMVARLMKDKHLTRKAAEEVVSQAAQAEHIMSIPEGERTPQQKRDLEAASQNPNVSDVAKWSKSVKDSTLGVSTERDSAYSDQDKSTATRADLFASAPDLTEQHRQAVAAVEPLDAPKAPTVKVASADPPPPAPGSNMGGLSV